MKHPTPPQRLRRRGWAAPATVLLAVAAGGCGSNLQQVLFQSATAVGRTALDAILTQFLNDLDQALSGQDGQPSGDVGTGDVGTGNTGTGNGGNLADLTGDPVSGEALFSANGCSGCHCADATGGCLAGAPPITGVPATTVDERLRGSVNHPIKPNVSDQDVVDLAAWLGTLP